MKIRDKIPFKTGTAHIANIVSVEMYRRDVCTTALLGVFFFFFLQPLHDVKIRFEIRHGRVCSLL